MGISRRSGPARLALAAALAVEAVLVLLDVLTGQDLILTTTFVIPPVALAIFGRPRDVALVSAAAVLLALASGLWDGSEFAFSGDHLVRTGIVAIGGGLAVIAARAIGGAAADRRRMEVLAAVGRLSGAERVEDAVAGLDQALVPAVADRCWVEVGGESLRGFAVENRFADSRSGRASVLDTATVNLLSGEDVIGTLGLETTAASGRRFTEADRAFFGVLAGRVALVVANARLVTDLRSTRARLDGILGGLAEAVTVHDEQGQTVYANEAAARLLGRSSPADVVRAQPGELGSRFAITKEDGSPVAMDELPGRRLVAGEDAPALLTRSVDRVTGQAYWLLTKATRLEEEGAVLAVNVIEDVTEAKESELRQRFLARAGQLLASSLDYQETLRRVADLAVPWLADWCAVDLPEGDSIRQVALAHSDPSKVAMAEELRRRRPPDADAETGVPAVLRGGEAELFREIPDELITEAIDDPEELEAVRALGMRSAMVVPMRLGQETLGAISFVSADSGRRFDEDDFAFAQDLALRAASAVQNARLYEEQARVAHTLQASLLPDRLPELPGWRGAASYQAGEQGADVGGDFYDIAPAGGGRHLVFLGDVTGKGIAAAALTSLVRHSVRTGARFDPRPGAVLALINDILVEQPRLSPVTLVCALVHDARVTVAAGGHPPPLLRHGGKVVELGAKGVLLGAVPRQTYREETVVVDQGDMLLLYTDGVTDTPGPAERFGHLRLSALLDAAPDEPDAVLARIEDALRDFQTGTAVDDRAMVVLRFAGRAGLAAAA
jgi:PAS domain S-box-containing protein